MKINSADVVRFHPAKGGGYVGLTQKINAEVSQKCRCDLTRGTRGKALRQSAFKVAHLAAGGIAFCIFYYCVGPNKYFMTPKGVPVDLRPDPTLRLAECPFEEIARLP